MKNKLTKFAENKTFDRLYQPGTMDILNADYEMKGKWNSDCFHNNNPIVLELGCGRGEYTVQQALMFPNKNFIGMDIKGSRIYTGAKYVHENKVLNAAFVRGHIEMIRQIFSKEISEVWITFPDPSVEKERRRLTSPMFLNRYRPILKDDAIVYLKTDSDDLYEYTMEILPKNNCKIIANTNDYYASEFAEKLPPIQTTYEKRFLSEGKKIKLIKFQIFSENLK